MWRKSVIRLIAGLLTVLLALSLAACSTRKKDEGVLGVNQTSANGTKGSKEEATGKGYQEDEYGNYVGTEVPKGFPTDVLPILEGSVIGSAVKDNMQVLYTSYAISASTDKPYEEVEGYYKGVMSKLQEVEERTQPGYYQARTETGVKKDYAVNVIDVKSGFVATEGMPENAKTVIMLMYKEYKELPKGYRADLVPVMEGSIPLEGKIWEKDNGTTEYRLTYDIKKDYKDVTAYYKEIMSNAGSYNDSIYDVSATFEGIKDNAKITILIDMKHDRCTYSIIMEV